MGGTSSVHNFIPSFLSRRASGYDASDPTSSGQHLYKYPPKHGPYFGPYFIMGDKRFETLQPEAYLFGPNQDLNLLGYKPVPLPYSTPRSGQPTHCLKSLVHVRKHSIKFVKQSIIFGTATASPLKDEVGESYFSLEFSLDADVSCDVIVYFFAQEEINDGYVSYKTKSPAFVSEAIRVDPGAGISYSNPHHVISPALHPKDSWAVSPENATYAVVIQCVAVNPESPLPHSHVVLCGIERNSADEFVIKPFRQKQIMDGVCFLLQEVYGVENKLPQDADCGESEDELLELGSECVVCMSEVRDTVILPCRHLCLCAVCADHLRCQAQSCPICRADFHTLLQLRALRRRDSGSLTNPVNSSVAETDADEVIPGYVSVSLVESLNGPSMPVLRSSGESEKGPMFDYESSVQNELNSSHKKRKKKMRVTLGRETPAYPTDGERTSNGEGKPETGSEPAPADSESRRQVGIVCDSEVRAGEIPEVAMSVLFNDPQNDDNKGADTIEVHPVEKQDSPIASDAEVDDSVEPPLASTRIVNSEHGPDFSQSSPASDSDSGRTNQSASSLTPLCA